jgi:hypothetical protein
MAGSTDTTPHFSGLLPFGSLLTASRMKKLCGARIPMSPGRLQRAIAGGYLERYLRRAGHTCRRPAMPNGRCVYHGGRSTGPRTAAGKARALANLKLRWRVEGSED